MLCLLLYSSSTYRIERAVLNLDTNLSHSLEQNSKQFESTLTQISRHHTVFYQAMHTQAISQQQQTLLHEEILSRGSGSRTIELVDNAALTEDLKSNPVSDIQDRTSTVLPPIKAVHATTTSTLSIQLCQRRKCIPCCKCDCHASSSWRSPSYLDAFMGALVFSYSGFAPLTPKCNEPLCRGNMANYVHTKYCFPNWFLERAVYMLAVTTDFGGPMLGLTVRRRTPYRRPNSIFQMAVVGNVEGIRELLEKRLASPNDVDTDFGETPLWVSIAKLSCDLDSRLDLFAMSSRF